MRRELSGRHVLAAILVFFGVTISVNAAMAIYAITTFSGEDVPNPYIQGLAYNKTIAAHAAQEELGWTATIDAVREGQATRIVVVIHDSRQRELSNLKVEMILRRPTNAKLDREETLAQNGTIYSATVRGLLPGAWDVVARTTAPNGTLFEATRRVALQ